MATALAAALRADYWSYDSSFQPALVVAYPGSNPYVGYVDEFLRQPNGRYLITGYFDQVDGLPLSSHGDNLVQLNPDGSLDRSFAFNGVSADNAGPFFVQPDGHLIYGTINSSEIVSVNGIQRLNADGSVDSTFSVPTQTSLYAVDAQGRLYTTTGQAGALQRRLPNGSVDSTFAVSITGTVLSVSPLLDGRLIVAHIASQTGGQVLVRLLQDGTLDSQFTALILNTSAPFAVLPDGTILATSIGVQPDTILVSSGTTTTPTGQPPSPLYLEHFSAQSGTADFACMLASSDTLGLAGVLFDRLLVAGGGEASLPLYASPVGTSGTIDVLSTGQAIICPSGELLSNIPPISRYQRSVLSSPSANLAPQIAIQPANAVVAEVGGTQSFSVQAIGLEPFTYQWSLNGAPIPGATNPALGVTYHTSADLGSYSVTVSNAAGSVASQAATLSAGTGLPYIEFQPASTSVYSGTYVQLSVSAYPPMPSTNAALSYQWLLNGIPISGATSTSYGWQAQASGNYSVAISNSAGTILSSVASVTVLPKPLPSFTTQPQDQVAVLGTQAGFVAAAYPADTYQWYKNGTAVAGATGSTFLINAATAADFGTYSVTATDSAGAVSSRTAILSQGSPTVGQFLHPPTSLTVAQGTTAVFHAPAVAAIGLPNSLNYQWQQNGQNLAGQTDAYLILPQIGSNNMGTYTCTISDSAGTVASSPATLTMLAASAASSLTNLSVLTTAAPGQNVTVGFSSGGASGSLLQPVLLRAVGPSLQPLGIDDYLPDPILTVYSGTQALLTNGSWASSPANQAAVTAADAAFTGLPLISGSRDAAVVTSLAGGSYSMVTASAAQNSGSLLAEVYDATPAGSASAQLRLVNVSCLQHISTSGVLTAGFTISGSGAKSVLIRTVGPALAGFGVSDPLPDPTLKLFHGTTEIDSNLQWAGDAVLSATAANVGAFPLNNSNSTDCVLATSLAPGAYSVQCTSASGTAGTALIEVYEVP